MALLDALLATLIVLIVGDFLSTFFYHVPQHVWFTLHLRTHHDRRRSYWDHAVISRDPFVLLDGLLGALPYIALAAFLWWTLSPVGAVIGLALGQLHVWWRHTVELGWKTPAPIARLCRVLAIVLPEDHNGHHVDPEVEFGDIFRFYDAPARAVLATFRRLTPHASRRSASRSRRVRRLRPAQRKA